MINFLKMLFGFAKKESRDEADLNKRPREHEISHDMIDYDGMGNQGRFPTHK